MPHSYELPAEIDLDAVRTIIDFVRGRIPFSRDVVAAGYCLLGYALGQVAASPRLVGSPADPREVDAVALDTLDELVAEQQISQGIIPWALLVEWLVSKLLSELMKSSS